MMCAIKQTMIDAQRTTLPIPEYTVHGVGEEGQAHEGLLPLLLSYSLLTSLLSK